MSDHWKSIADLLGAPGMDARKRLPVEPPALGPVSTEYSDNEAVREKAPKVAPAKVEVSRENVKPPRERVVVEEAQPTVSAQPPAVQEPKEEPPKRRSSWDSLTKLFGLSSSVEAEPSRSTPVAPEPQPARVSFEAVDRKSARADRDDREQTRQKSEPTNEVQSTSALDALFQDAPRQGTKDWRDESSLRIVDDVSWETDDSNEDITREVIKPTAESDEEASGQSRRRRRRRRGGSGRGRGAEEGHRDSESQLEPEKPTWPEGSPDDSAEIADPWKESRAIDGDSESGEFEAERRSHRRRRRGRDSRRDETPTVDRHSDSTPKAARSSDRDAEEVRSSAHRDSQREELPKADRDRSRSRDRDRTDRSRGERDVRDRGHSSDRKSGPERVVDRGRTGPDRESPTHERPRNEIMDDDIDESFDAEVDGDLDDAGNKHRKIPSWAESLETIIANNMDNHRRYDGGRDQGPRGRPRGRR